MPYITQTQRLWLKQGKEIGREEGRVEGKREELLQVLRSALSGKFGSQGNKLAEELKSEIDLTKLRAIFAAIMEGESLNQLRKMWKS